MKRAAFLLVLGCIVLGCRNTPDDDDAPFSPEMWDQMSERMPLCLDSLPLAPAKVERQTWTLRKPNGALDLPATFREVATTTRGERTWVGADSSRVVLRVTSEPSGGLASSAPIVIESRCALPMAGHRALSALLRSENPTAGRTAYMADANVVLRDDMALNVWIETPDMRMRDLLLRLVSRMRVTP